MPKQVKDLYSFLGMVQYYRDLWARRSEMLALLTTLVGECGHTKVTRAKKTKKWAWHWDEVHQIAFDTVKATIARDVVLAYPDYLKEFEIYTDASSKHLGVVITQGNKSIGFFSEKLTETQQRKCWICLDFEHLSCICIPEEIWGFGNCIMDALDVYYFGTEFLQE